jgi:hypothetical protein
LRRARWTIFWERLWPALATLATAAGLFLTISWLGVWLWLPPLGRAAAVLAFAVIALAAAAPFVFVRVPAIADGKGAQGLAQSMQQQMGQGPGPGRTGRLGPPRAQHDTDPLGRPLRGREYGDEARERKLNDERADWAEAYQNAVRPWRPADVDEKSDASA